MAGEPGRTRYPRVFEPLALGPTVVPNRIYMAPHGIPLSAPTIGSEQHHEPAVERAHYFAERAAGGVGTIFHSTLVAPFASQTTLAETPGLPESIPSYAAVADAVHRHGAKIMAEIWYVSWMTKLWEPLGPEAPALAPSPTQQLWSPSTCHSMSETEITRYVEANAVATTNLRAAGYDGIEVHVSHGSLLEYFLSPYFNHRSDRYGGTLENRMRLMLETLEAVRAAAGGAMAVGIRLTADQMLSGGIDSEGTREVLERLTPTGLIDFVDLDISVEPEQTHLMSTNFFEPKHHNAARVARLSDAVHPLPLLSTPGRLTSVADAEKMIASGDVDMVGAARGLIADPELVQKALEGREFETRICVAVNACVDNSTGWGCAINPAAGKENRWGIRQMTAAPRSMNVVVVGGGPCGLEAARVAALRGHTVTVFERRAELGGGVALWARLPGRESLASLPLWFRGRLEDLDVDVRTGSEANRQLVSELQPDVVILAAGSRYHPGGASAFAPRPIPGWQQDWVVAPEQVLAGDVRLSGRVLVVDDEGYHAAAGIAEMAAEAGAETELVTRKPSAGASLGLMISYVVGRLQAVGVTMTPYMHVSRIGDHSVTLRSLSGGYERVVDDVDTLVVATMREPVDHLATELDTVPYLYLVGDALAPRGLREATYEGHKFARLIGDPDMPSDVAAALFEPHQGMRPAATG
jgi:2,4-dienoyl-CoA reductase-like NADH-dependent reductase (Old Yellow Enzyme family)